MVNNIAMNISKSVKIIAVVFTAPFFLFLMDSCRTRQNKAETDSVSPDFGIVKLTSEQVKVAGLTFGRIEKHLLSYDIHAKGKLILPPQNDASVSSMIPGSVEKIHVTEGSLVEKGELLATITAPSIVQLQQDYISALTRLEMARKEYDRQKILNREKISAEKMFQEIEADLKEKESIVESLKLQLGLLNIPPADVSTGKISKSARILSPINGYVEEVSVNIGHYVAPEEPLFRIINRDKLYIELMVFEKDIPFIRNGQRVTFKLANLGGEEYEARVLSVGKMVEESARTVKIIAELNNRSGIILPGMFVSAEIHTDEQNLDALPEDAVVIEDENNAYVYYTVSPDDSKEKEFKRVQVRTGFREEGFIQVELLSPVPPNARIVLQGAYFIKAEGLKNAN